MADLDLTRLDGGTRANVLCAVEALGRLGNFIAAALDLIGGASFDGTPEEGRTISALIESVRGEMIALRAHLYDLATAEDLSRLDEPASPPPRVTPTSIREEFRSLGDHAHSGAIKPMDLWAHAAPASNAAGDVHDLSMVLVRALGTHDLGFAPNELAALHTVASMLQERAKEAAGHADAVCELIDRREAA